MPTQTSKTLAAKLGPAGAPWRSKGAIVAALAGVGIVGVLIGRASAPGSAPPPQVSAAASSATTAPTPQIPQQFDLTEDPRSKAGIALRPMDRDILDQITHLERIPRTQMKDVFPDRPYRVAFVGSVAERRVGLVMIDLDRDGKFEERWDLKGSEITRNVIQDPASGGVPGRYTLARGRWQVH